MDWVFYYLSVKHNKTMNEWNINVHENKVFSKILKVHALLIPRREQLLAQRSNDLFFSSDTDTAAFVCFSGKERIFVSSFKAAALFF